MTTMIDLGARNADRTDHLNALHVKLAALTTFQWTKIGHKHFRMSPTGELEVRARFGTLQYAHGVGLRDALSLATNQAHLVGTSCGRGRRHIELRHGGI